jgi:hypothetical protein
VSTVIYYYFPDRELGKMKELTSWQEAELDCESRQPYPKTYALKAQTGFLSTWVFMVKHPPHADVQATDSSSLLCSSNRLLVTLPAIMKVLDGRSLGS